MGKSDLELGKKNSIIGKYGVLSGVDGTRAGPLTGDRPRRCAAAGPWGDVRGVPQIGGIPVDVREALAG